MDIAGWLQIILYCLIITALTKPVGSYIYWVFEGERKAESIFSKIELKILQFFGSNSPYQTAREYSINVIFFSIICIAATMLLLMIQQYLPLNPRNFENIPFLLALNTAVSFVTNTNWQAYAGESAMSYLSQAGVLTWQNFISAAAGMSIAIAVSRGVSGKPLGNFWNDLLKSVLFILLPGSLILALIFLSQGVIQNFGDYLSITTLEGGTQTIPMGGVASQEAIKMLGTNGGGFFNANSSHPFENPTPLTNFIQMLALFMIPAGLTHAFGKITGDTKQGWSLFIIMAVLFLTSLSLNYWLESENLTGYNMEGKEVRFGVANSSLFATITTSASAGAVNAMHDSFHPLSGMLTLINMLLGEIVYGGVGAGLYGMLIYVILAVFIAGLMVGRTPEYLGRKIEPFEMKMTIIALLILPLCILGGTAWTLTASYGVASVQELGIPHGLTEILYAFTSATANNGSAFAGINANTNWMNVALSFCMLMGRFVPIMAILAIAGSMSNKRAIPTGTGTFPTTGALFISLTIGIILIIGALTFFPVLILGPVIEHLQIITQGLKCNV